MKLEATKGTNVTANPVILGHAVKVRNMNFKHFVQILHIEVAIGVMQ